MPAPLDQAFGFSNDIQVKKKKKSKKEIIYPDELQALTEPRLLPSDPDNFFPVQQFQKSPQKIKEEQLQKKQEELEKREMMLQHQTQHVPKQEDPIYPQRLVISDHEWNEFKRYQAERHNRARTRPINAIEPFTTMNDDFNDVLLFGILGVFFLIFTDYIYKLGRKSY